MRRAEDGDEDGDKLRDTVREVTHLEKRVSQPVAVQGSLWEDHRGLLGGPVKGRRGW